MKHTFFFVCDLILWNIKEDIYPPAPKHLLSLNCANVHFVIAFVCTCTMCSCGKLGPPLVFRSHGWRCRGPHHTLTHTQSHGAGSVRALWRKIGMLPCVCVCVSVWLEAVSLCVSVSVSFRHLSHLFISLRSSSLPPAVFSVYREALKGDKRGKKSMRSYADTFKLPVLHKNDLTLQYVSPVCKQT